MAACDAAVCTSAAAANPERAIRSGRTAAYRMMVLRRLYETWQAEVKRLLDRCDEPIALLGPDVLDRHARLLVLAGRVDEEPDAGLARGDRLVAEELVPDALARRIRRDRAGQRGSR